jgi:hypothetical protein
MSRKQYIKGLFDGKEEERRESIWKLAITALIALTTGIIFGKKMN